MVEAVVLHPPSGDGRLLAGGSGDGRGAGVCLQAAGVGEPLAIVPDFGKHPGAELDAEAGEAEDDLSVRVLRESLFHRLGQIVGGGAGGFKLDQEGEHLLAQRVLDQRRLMGPVRAEDFAGRLTLTVRYADRNSTTRTRTLPEPTDHSPALAAAALELLTALGLQRARARAFTIRADNLLPARNAYRQLSLDPGDARARAAEAAADRAHRRFGPETVRPATLAG